MFIEMGRPAQWEQHHSLGLGPRLHNTRENELSTSMYAFIVPLLLTVAMQLPRVLTTLTASPVMSYSLKLS